jgi:phage-related protein
MAARYLAGAAYVQVLPSLRGFQKQVGRELRTIDVQATARIAPVIDKAAASKAEDDVQALTDRLAKARDKEAAAVGKVRVAQEKYNAALANGKTTAAQLAAAEESLATATRNAARAKDEATKAAAKLTDAEKRHKDAVDDLETATRRGSVSLAALWRQGEGIDRMSKSMQKARRESLLLAAGVYRVASGVTAIGSAVPAVTALGGALGAASGVGLLVPGALATGGIAVAALKVGVSGLGDAMKAAAEGDAEKLAEATAKLAPPARAVVGEYLRFKPALDRIRLDVQARMFRDLAGEARWLGQKYLPIVREGLVGMAGNLNAVGKETAGFLRQQQTLRDLPFIFTESNRAVGNLTGTTQPLLSILRDISAVGVKVVADLTAGADSLTAGWADFIAEARATGQLEQWIYAGLQALDDLWRLASNVGSIFSSIFDAASASSGGGVLATVNQVTGAIAGLLSSAEGQNALITFFDTVHSVVQNLLPGVNAVAGALFAGIVELAPHVPPLASAFSAAAIAVAPLIVDLAALASDILPPLIALITWLSPALPVLAAGFAAGYLALKGYLIVSRIVRFIQAWAAAQWALNAAMTANPIGIIVVAIAALVAGFIYLWNNSEAFRNFWIGLWEAIKTAAVWVWENVLKPTWNAIVAALKWVGETAAQLWTGYIQPAFQAIGAAASAVWSVLGTVFDAIVTALKFAGAIIFTLFVTPYVLAFNAVSAVATWLWQTVLSPFVDLNVAAFRLLAGVAMWLWSNGIKPAFDGIAAVATWLWQTVLKPFIDLNVAAFQLLAGVVLWLWNEGIKLAFDGIAAAATWLWGTVLKPFIDLNVAAFQLLASVAMWLWNNGIKPAFDGIAAAISWVWENGIRPTFDAIKHGVNLVGEAFDKAVNFISSVWDKIKGIAAKPVNFIIETVYNQGIKAVWDKVAGFVDLDPLPLANPITFAGGGVLSGYAPGRDTELALLSRGEAVLVPELVRDIGPRNIIAANAAASGRPAGGDGGFAGGGPVRRFAGGGIVGTLFDWIPGIGDDLASLWESPAAWVKARIGGAGGLVDMLAAIPETLISKAAEWLSSKVSGLFGTGGGAVSGQLADWVRAAMTITGVGPDWFTPLTTLIMRESGGNPQAINLWDINAQNGIPSQGLMQTIPPTFAAHRDPRLPNEITHPIANIVAGINYIRSRYGSIFNVQQANPSAPPMGYDSGGYLPPGYSTVYNGTGRPEAVLTDEQWARLGDGLGGPMAISGDITINGLDGHIEGRIQAANSATASAVYNRRR